MKPVSGGVVPAVTFTPPRPRPDLIINRLNYQRIMWSHILFMIRTRRERGRSGESVEHYARISGLANTSPKHTKHPVVLVRNKGGHRHKRSHVAPSTKRGDAPSNTPLPNQALCKLFGDIKASQPIQRPSAGSHSPGPKPLHQRKH